MKDDRKADLQGKVRRLAENLSAMIDEDHPLAAFAVLYYEAALGRLRGATPANVPAPFGDTPLIDVVEAMLPSVSSRDPESARMIRALLDRVRKTSDPEEKRTLGQALEWFYLYFTGQIETEFRSWLSERDKTRQH